MNLTELSKIVHKANAKWWQDTDTGAPIKRNKGELLALIHSEISEGFEGECENAMDDKLTHRLMGEVEQVDAFIRTLDYAAGFNHDIGSKALLLGISNFDDLNHFAKCVMVPERMEIYPKLKKHGVAAIHAQISRVLEHERKGRAEEAAMELVRLLVFIGIYSEIQGYDLQGAFDDKMAFNATTRSPSSLWRQTILNL